MRTLVAILLLLLTAIAEAKPLPKKAKTEVKTVKGHKGKKYKVTQPVPKDIYWKLYKDPRKGHLTEDEYRYLRDNIPTGDPFRGLTSREWEAIDEQYRDDP